MVKLSKHHEEILLALITRYENGSLEGAFQDIPIEVYHNPRCPGVSSTFIKSVVEKSYNHAVRKPFQSTPEMAFGTAFHTYMQGQKDFLARYSVGKIEPGKEFVSWDNYSRMKIMHDNILKHPIASALTVGGLSERTFFAKCPVTGILRKCRPDNMKQQDMSDYKSTFDASPAGFSRQARKLMYRISAAYYMDTTNDALRAIGNNSFVQTFKFIAVENDDLHEVAVYDASDRSLEVARAEIQTALNHIRNATTGGWTGYPLYQEPISI